MPLIFSFDIDEYHCYFVELIFFIYNIFFVCGIVRISTFAIMSWVDIDNSTFFQIEMPLISLSVSMSIFRDCYGEDSQGSVA